MKDSTKNLPLRDKTHPILLNAVNLLAAYAQATGALTCICDHNYLPIPEILDDLLAPKNICLFCIKYKSQVDVKSVQELCLNPCREMHINAARKAGQFGGSCTYMCDLGFMFWTSPIYLDEHFIGALQGSGYLGTNQEELHAQMYRLCEGAAAEAELREKTATFPQGSPLKIKSLAELLLICAESLSSGSNDYHAVLRRRAEQQSELSAKIEELKNKYPSGGQRPGYPFDKEEKLLDALRQGDIRQGREILNEMLALLVFSNPDQFKYIQYRAIELVVLLSRADISPGFPAKTILETNNRYLNSIQEVRSIEELTDALYRIVDDMAGQIFTFQGVPHASALKKAEHFIWENYSRKISLEEIAQASGFSAPYFSTIFKEEMGENLSSYLNRLRVEKAGYMLTNTNLSLSKITRACGFEDQSWFSKIFKHYTGMSPGKYRNQGGRTHLKSPEVGLSDDYRSLLKPD
jgi:AraC-like DNA-binding protein/ligand-binding sensor protein